MIYARFIPGKPEPQGSTKAFGFRGKGGRICASTTTANKALYPWRAAAVRILQDPNPELFFAGPVKITAHFIMPRLESHPKTLRGKQPWHHTTKPDLDKLQRALGDALVEAAILTDDSLIVHWDADKHFAGLTTDPPGVHVMVELLPEVS